MAKKNKKRQDRVSKKTPSKIKSKKSTKSVVRNVERPIPISENDALLRKVFWGIAGVGLLWMLIASLGSGLNADDKFQNDYSAKLVSYYFTFGKDTSALYVKDGNMHLYGGFFEIVTGFANKAFGLDKNDHGYHDVRHVSSAFLGWIAILCAALLARLIAGWQAALLTFLLMLLSPRFFGDSLMNPKDIPFAAGYMLAIYNLAVVLKSMPKPKWIHLAGLTGGLAIALATRAGGLLPFAMVFFFGGLHFLWKNGFSGLGNGKLLGRYAAVTLGVSAVGYFLAVLFWPYALQNPIKNPFAALSKFEELEVQIRVLYEGANIMSDTTPSTYALKWVFMTIPLAAIVGFVGFFAFLPKMWKKYEPVLLGLVAFAGIFPIFYVVYKNSVLHDGWRHLTFAYPGLAIMAALFWNELVQFFKEKKALQYAAFGAFGLLLVDAAAFQIMNPKLPYVYFNPIQGGTSGALGHFETDYWGISLRQGVEWMEEEGILSENMSEPVTIATNMFYPVHKYLRHYGDNVKVLYMKWDRRCDAVYDYGLYPTRFIDGSALRKGKWPPDNAIHIVKAGGAPILAVLKNDGSDCADGIAASKKGDWTTTIEKLKSEVAKVPDNELAWGTLANAYINTKQLEEGKAAAEKGLEINPNDTQCNNMIGMYFLQKGDANAAKNQFQNALKNEPSNPGAYYYLALIAQNQGDNQTALRQLEKCLKIAPRFRPAYQLAAQIHDAIGNKQQANKIRQMMQ